VVVSQVAGEGEVLRQLHVAASHCSYHRLPTVYHSVMLSVMDYRKAVEASRAQPP
jgi:hypothetical protein